MDAHVAGESQFCYKKVPSVDRFELLASTNTGMALSVMVALR